eukprot:gnl/TRDRNA2_/TRDRNA2_36982_c0_seq1.p1 gnl/TRDRNA2_/TRDRNA2_36982_c0~~gnl/TRDRNA2_/TRDRNA2_36982_c0_seq1.p1  ORF type:complete len:309 (+),score=71.87 gnl/TRDRNA2_/TRDRNA2_36982_c0_seq1:63-989(+)
MGARHASATAVLLAMLLDRPSAGRFSFHHLAVNTHGLLAEEAPHGDIAIFPELKDVEGDPVVVPMEHEWESHAEDAECFCFSGAKYNEEAKLKDGMHAGLAVCAGLQGDFYRCSEHCETNSKHALTLQGETGKQTASYCQDDGDCKCLDAATSFTRAHFSYKKVKTFKVTNLESQQWRSIAVCYLGCKTLCEDAGFDDSGCIWPMKTRSQAAGASPPLVGAGSADKNASSIKPVQAAAPPPLAVVDEATIVEHDARPAAAAVAAAEAPGTAAARRTAARRLAPKESGHPPAAATVAAAELAEEELRMS